MFPRLLIQEFKEEDNTDQRTDQHPGRSTAAASHTRTLIACCGFSLVLSSFLECSHLWLDFLPHIYFQLIPKPKVQSPIALLSICYMPGALYTSSHNSNFRSYHPNTISLSAFYR